MYLELKKKIREYKTNSDTFSVEPINVSYMKKNLWDYDISLKENTHPFLSSYLDLSRGSSYDLDGFEIQEKKEKAIDTFEKECYGSRGIITNLIRAEHVDSDWFNGVFLAQEIISKLAFNKFSATINTWHSGCQTGLLRGFNHFCKSSKYSSHKKIEWNWKGIDIKDGPLKDNIYIGATGNSDITISGNIMYLSNKIKEEWKEGADIVFHDIYPKNEKTLFSGVISSIMFLNNKGYMVLRLPEPELWDTNVVNCILMMCMLFQKVKLWIPPWGRRNKSKKYYIVAFLKKKTIYRNNYRSLLKILKSSSQNKRFIQKTVHDDEEIKDWTDILQNIKLEMIEVDEITKTDHYISNLTDNMLILRKKI